MAEQATVSRLQQSRQHAQAAHREGCRAMCGRPGSSGAKLAWCCHRPPALCAECSAGHQQAARAAGQASCCPRLAEIDRLLLLAHCLRLRRVAHSRGQAVACLLEGVVQRTALRQEQRCIVQRRYASNVWTWSFKYPPCGQMKICNCGSQAACPREVCHDALHLEHIAYWCCCC